MQNTLSSPATFTGFGLHSGLPVRMVVRPAAADHGIWFRRTDLDLALIPARWDAVTPSRLCTVVANANGDSVSTIEHVMAAIMAISDRIVVINSGRMIAEGSPEAIAKDRTVIEAYLGEEYVAASA